MSKLPIRHRPATSDTEHERDFWAWKYERREAECEELAGRLTALLDAIAEACDQETAERLNNLAIAKPEQVGGSGG